MMRRFYRIYWTVGGRQINHEDRPGTPLYEVEVEVRMKQLREQGHTDVYAVTIFK